jgi:aminomuconate-semialdehyde/2-hydroxymuconate-6-semialdehyde dehydrogenase
MTHIQNYIDGRFRNSASGETLDLIDPSCGKTVGSLPESGMEDVLAAVESASAAFHAWSSAGPTHRSLWLNKLADGIEARLDDLAHAESQDTGKPFSVARSVDIPRAVANFRFFAGAILHDSSEAYVDRPWVLNYTLRQPLGVVGCISPWNLPLYLFSWKIAPALAAGNCVVGKPSEVTPLTAYLLSEICSDIGFPAGVLNVIHGTGPSAGAPLVSHPEVKAISFTGGTATGRIIARTASDTLKKVSLELGGKNPTIIFEDANLEAAADAAMEAAFANQGQICLCGSRILIQKSVYEKVKKMLVQKSKKLKVGDPRKETTRMGALVSEAHLNKVLHHIEVAKNEGGRILTGGHRITMRGRCKNGYFLAPTLIEGLSPLCATNQEEIFGPVATLMPFETEQEAVAMANSTRYGLAASVWTRDLDTANRVSESLQSGIVWVNCWMLRDLRTPFGGVKESGVGREGGTHALRFFTEAKNVCIKTS